MSASPNQFADADESMASEDGHRRIDKKLIGSSKSSSDEPRPDGKGYIDEVVPAQSSGAFAWDGNDEGGSARGSSVEEDSEVDYLPQIDGHGAIYGEEHFGSFAEDDDEDEDEGLLPPDFRDQEDIDHEENQDWQVDDEDWELADGDFTKQYNRIRQQHAAVHSAHKASSSCLDAPIIAQNRPPLPARNSHPPRVPKTGTSSSQTAYLRSINPSLLSAGGVAANPKSSQDRQNTKDKSDRATHEQVLDSRTRLVLSGLVNRGVIGKIEGCISTGKEANVYHALVPLTPSSKPSPLAESLAVKIYRTSILSFKARQDYIVGEHRFRGGYASSHNPRKMVRLWAEKELRNLRRLQEGGIRAPRVVEGRENVLVMEFLGTADHASPRLKDADVSNSKLAGLYAELLVAMRRMYHHCKLVHADLSEYNMLYHDSHLYIIDVSQSVEHDHPRSFDFLRTDIRNVEDYFNRRSGGEVKTLGVQRVWNFVVDETVGSLSRADEVGTIGEERLLDVIREWLEKDASSSSSKGAAVSDGQLTKSDDAVFMSSYIPRSLAEVYDPERDVDILRSGGADKLIYAGLTGLKISGKVHSEKCPAMEETVSVESTVKKGVRFEGDDGTTSEEEGDEDVVDRQPRGFRHEDKQAKKERKKALKEENREKRKHKMPKAEKQKAIKKTSGKS